MKIITDPGSTHLGKLSKALELIHISKDCGADAIKFQLFKDSEVNIPIPYDCMHDLKDCADNLEIEIFASVWDIEGIDILEKVGCKSIKFAYSMRKSELIYEAIKRKFDDIYVSCGVMDKNIPFTKRLYCIPEYPVPFVPAFDSLFPERFSGFSDHTMGYQYAVKAAEAGAEIIEKHIRPGSPEDIGVPDGKFALKPDELRKMCNDLKPDVKSESRWRWLK